MISFLYALGMVALVAYGGHLLWLAWGYVEEQGERGGVVPSHEEYPEEPDVWPRVLVQIPVYNERYVVERVIDACAQLDYPSDRLTVQVLDDSTDDTTEIARERVARWRKRGVSIELLHREHREGFKAGALQHGLEQTESDLVAVFDADFRPEPDFLRRTVPEFAAPEVGMVQGRWGHLNEEVSVLTRVQAMSLDAHFAVEQYVRNRRGHFMNFNGTAGIWRRSCIREAGGWEGDTLTEDLDLSYRAQMAGWQFRYLPDLEVPAELPVDMRGLRQQQFRWAKGAIQTAGKLLGSLWRSDQPSSTKWAGSFHLLAHGTFPFVVLVALLHAPLLVLEAAGAGPGPVYFAAMGFGLWAFLGVVLAQLLAQRELHPDWLARTGRIVWFLAGTMGLAVNNARAVVEALAGRTSPFTRTPKFRITDEDASSRWWKALYAGTGSTSPIVWVEFVLGLYCTAGLGALVGIGAWSAVPFQALFAAAFLLVSVESMRQAELGEGD